MLMMTMTMTPPATGADRADDLRAWAAEAGVALAASACRHDLEGSWVGDSFDHLRERGFLALAVPAELGGHGATIAEVSAVIRELARHCGSTALAMSMHQHVTAFTAWRYRRGLPGAEATFAASSTTGSCSCPPAAATSPGPGARR